MAFSLKDKPFFLLALMVFFSSFFFSCAEKKKEQQASDFLAQKEAALQKETLSVPPVIQLLPAVKKETAQWLAYITAQAEIQQWDGESLYAITNKSDAVLQIMQALQAKVPTPYQVKPVLARLRVLLTLANVLDQKIEDERASVKTIKETIHKIPIAFNSLKVQLNEVHRNKLEDFHFLMQQNDSLPAAKPQTN